MGETGVLTVFTRGGVRIPLPGCKDLQVSPCLDAAFALAPAPCAGSAEAVEAFSYIWVGMRQLKNLTHWFETEGMYL